MLERSVKRTAVALFMATMAMADDTARPANDVGVCEGLFRLANTMDFDHAWTGTIRLRQMEPSCVGSENERTYWHMRATMENLLGNHREALEYARTAPGSGDDLPASAESEPAIPYILTRVRGHRIVMVNEQHRTEEACVVEAFNVAWEDRAVPYARVEINSAMANLFLPPGVDVDLRGYRLDGSPAFRRTLIRVPPGATTGLRVPGPYRYWEPL